MDVSGINSKNHQPIEIPKKARQSEEITTASTDDVDSEIENLKTDRKNYHSRFKIILQNAQN